LLADVDHLVEHFDSLRDTRHIQQQRSAIQPGGPKPLWIEGLSLLMLQAEERSPIVVEHAEYAGVETKAGRLSAAAQLGACKRLAAWSDDIQSDRDIDVIAELVQVARSMNVGGDFRGSGIASRAVGPLSNQVLER
jgi:hypothetical protein